jgi:hypothetical protein
MKLLINILSIILILFLAATQELSAQVEINVFWITNCGDTCVSHDTCSYAVTYRMYYICNGHHDLLCDNTKNVNCSSSLVNFDCEYSCDDPSNNQCYLITATATKLCTGKNGTISICTGHGNHTYRCYDIMHLPCNIQVFWD